MDNHEESIKKLERRTLTTYAATQFAFFCRLRTMGDDGAEPLKHLHDVGFDVIIQDGKYHLTEPTKQTTLYH